MGLAKPGETCGMTVTGPGLAHPESAGRVLGWGGNRTDQSLPCKPGPLAGHLDPLRTLYIHDITHNNYADVLLKIASREMKVSFVITAIYSSYYSPIAAVSTTIGYIKYNCEMYQCKTIKLANHDATLPDLNQ